jgi:hypothetical protein
MFMSLSSKRNTCAVVYVDLYELQTDLEGGGYVWEIKRDI